MYRWGSLRQVSNCFYCFSDEKSFYIFYLQLSELVYLNISMDLIYSEKPFTPSLIEKFFIERGTFSYYIEFFKSPERIVFFYGNRFRDLQDLVNLPVKSFIYLNKTHSFQEIYGKGFPSIR